MNAGVLNCEREEVCPSRNNRRGYSFVELMVTIAIVAVLSVIVGVLFAKLLSIQEREREEAYVREKLTDVCGAYADFLSIGSSIITTSTNATVVKYRQETGGVSLETGLVTRVAYLTSTMNVTNNTMDLNVFSLDPEQDELDKVISSKVTHRASGDAELLPLLGDIVSCTLTPLETGTSLQGREMAERDLLLCEKMVPHANFNTTAAALGRLVVKARYTIENDDGEPVAKTVTVERVVRLWNGE